MLKMSASAKDREAFLVKRRSFSGSDVSRFTNDEIRVTDEEDGHFEHPVEGVPNAQQESR